MQSKHENLNQHYELQYCLHCGRPIFPQGFDFDAQAFKKADVSLFCESCLREGWTKPNENQCGNCHAYLEPEDRFCRICGTRRGDGLFEPYQNLMQCIYGPMPVERVHVCSSCGYRWTTCLMVDRETFCPSCGGRSNVEEKDVDHDLMINMAKNFL